MGGAAIKIRVKLSCNSDPTYQPLHVLPNDWNILAWLGSVTYSRHSRTHKSNPWQVLVSDVIRHLWIRGKGLFRRSSESPCLRLGLDGRVRFGVGGILPDPTHAVAGKSDFIYKTTGQIAKFVTEMKVSTPYPPNELWYRRSRACQGICALYYTHIPMLLCSPRSFKVLMELADRYKVYMFPDGYYSGDPRRDDFLRIIGLLILSEK